MKTYNLELDLAIDFEGNLKETLNCTRNSTLEYILYIKLRTTPMPFEGQTPND